MMLEYLAVCQDLFPLLWFGSQFVIAITCKEPACFAGLWYTDSPNNFVELSTSWMELLEGAEGCWDRRTGKVNTYIPDILKKLRKGGGRVYNLAKIAVNV